ncbi:MAG: phosphoglycerate kinase, partial [Actinobacteria bacterium]|nr:phosphoglycerate kinase [Actinomycetota bacterium]
VPLDNGLITDDGRIRASLPTIRDLLARGAAVIVCAHFGRPKGDDYAARAAGGPSLRPVADRLAELLGQPVTLADDVAGESARVIAATMGAGEVALLENVRFEPAETSKDDRVRGELASRLAALADLYVGDGFGAMHRKHASVYDTPLLLPHAAGQLVLAEVAVLRQLTTSPARPYVVVLGGAKVSDKLAVIGNLIGKADRLLIAGGMAYTFLAAQGHQIGDSILQAEQIGQVTTMIAGAGEAGVELVLPVDHVVADRFAADAQPEVVHGPDIPDGKMGLDIGPATRDLFVRKLADAKTVFWNGPPGVFEFPAFAAGTRAVAEAISAVTGLTVVGGGDSAAAVRQLNLPPDAFTHISTGGGASLEYLEGRELPGLAALGDGT